MRRRDQPSNTGNEGASRRVKHRAQRGGASSSRAQQPEPVHQPHLSFGYLFDNNPAQHQQFVAEFANRPIVKPKSLDMPFFTNEGFDIVPLLEGSHLTRLAEMGCPYSEVMVRAFYHNLSYIHGDLTSRVCGIDIIMTIREWTAILGFNFDRAPTIHYDGDSTGQIEGFNRAEAVQEARRPGAHRAILSVGQLTVSSRVLFYVMTHILFPRLYNHSRVMESDIPVMWAIRHGIRVNWRHYICWMMYKAKQKENGALPYACLVQRILEHFGVPMHTERMKNLTTWNTRFGQRLLEQCKISQGPDGVWRFTGVDEDEPVGGPVPPIVPPEVHDEDDDDVEMEDIVEPEGGFSFHDVMKGINAITKKLGKMDRKQNKRWKWMQGRIKGLEDRLDHLQLGPQQAAPGDDDQGAPSDEEEAEDADTSD